MTINKADFLDKTLNIWGDRYKIVGVGAVDGDRVYLHLSSLTRFTQQRNGKCPAQACDWVNITWLEDIV